MNDISRRIGADPAQTKQAIDAALPMLLAALGKEAADPERAFFDSFVDEEVLAAVERLPPEFREAVVLSDLEGLGYGEIADILKVPMGTVKSRLYRGRKLLAKALRDYAVEMGWLRSGAA